jgi:hypothetical protein
VDVVVVVAASRNRTGPDHSPVFAFPSYTTSPPRVISTVPASASALASRRVAYERTSGWS